MAESVSESSARGSVFCRRIMERDKVNITYKNRQSDARVVNCPKQI